MMHVLKIAFCLIIVSVFSYAVPKVQSLFFYTGTGDKQIFVGQSLVVKLREHLSLSTEFESYLQSFEGTYFSPSLLDYKIGVSGKYVGWEHSCVHALDKQNSLQLPIRDRFFVRW